MARVVVVASSEIPRDALGDAVAPEDDVRIVVAAVEQSRLQWLANDEDEARARAREVATSISDAVPAGATDVDVKPDPPEQVVRDAVAEHRPDRIVLALREGDDASWLEDGALDELRGEIGGVPVERIRL